jgi:peptidoglycan-N-acetylglucosamine deacetylase
MTFDDACLSHRSVVAPRLKELGYGATFFVCEYPGIFAQQEHSMSWEQICELHDMGFEIGNHMPW